MDKNIKKNVYIYIYVCVCVCVCVCITRSLCCTAEIDRTLYINCNKNSF